MAVDDVTALAEAAVSLAHHWSAAPVVRDFTAPIKAARGRRSKSDEIAPFLAHVFAGYGSFAAQPLFLATYAQMVVDVEEQAMGGGLPETQAFAQAEEGRIWLESGRRVQEAFLRTVGWIRSRMPGYPTLNVPQLFRGSALMPESPTFRVPWRKTDLAAGYQTMNAPPGVARLIGISAEWEHACRRVAREFRDSEEVGRFKEAKLALSSADMEALKSARSNARQTLKAKSAKAPPGFMPQISLRDEMLAEACNGLPPAAQDYCEAFSNAELILQDVSSIFSQIVGFGGVPEFGNVASIETRPDGHRTHLRAVLNDEPGVLHIHSGGVILIEHAHVDLSPVLVQGHGYSFDRGQESTHHVDGFILPVHASVFDGCRLIP